MLENVRAHFVHVCFNVGLAWTYAGKDVSLVAQDDFQTAPGWSQDGQASTWAQLQARLRPTWMFGHLGPS